MRCLYCHREIKKLSLKSALLKEDLLCHGCRMKLELDRKIIRKEEMEVEVFFRYDSFFRDLLIQYKECMDEALKPVFLYDLSEYISLRYAGYRILLVPSSKETLRQRGFNHLEGIFESVKLKRVTGLKMKRELSQKGRNKTDRLAMKDNYVYEGEEIDRLLIADDVMTTGSSLLGVYRTMRSHCRKIRVISLSY